MSITTAFHCGCAGALGIAGVQCAVNWLMLPYAWWKEGLVHRLSFRCCWVFLFASEQGLAIHLLVSYDIIHAGHMPFRVRQVEEATQNFLVCIEMLVAALAFRYAYSASEYEHLSAEPAKPATAAATARKEPLVEQAKAASAAAASKPAPSPSESKKAQ